MLEYWMANNDTASNESELEIEEVLEDPGSAVLFAGYPPWLLYFAAGCCLLFMLIGIPGNLITVAALFRTKKLRNATAVFIMNLSVSDLMFCCFNLPLATSTFWHGSWLHGPLLCRLFPLLRYGLVAVSLFTVLAITINRYVMIGHPRLYPKLYKPKYLVLMVLATWVSGFGALVATWFEQWGRFGLDPAIGSCSILPDVNGRSPKEFLFILAFLTPCIAIIVCYARIFYIVRKTALKSRRKDKVTTDLVKASLEVKYTKNFEDSAIGSSCGATLTTTENGGSPTKNHEKNNFPLLTSSKMMNNHLERNIVISRNENNSKLLENISCHSSKIQKLKNTGKDGNCEEFCEDSRQRDDFSEADKTSLNQVAKSRENLKRDVNNVSSSKNIEENIVDDSQNVISRIPDLQIQGEKYIFNDGEDNSDISSDNDEERQNDRRSNFERSVEFLPFIDNFTEERQPDEDINDDDDNDDDDDDDDIDSVFGPAEKSDFRSIPNLRFFDTDSKIQKSNTDRRGVEKSLNSNDYCLKVPLQRSFFSRSSDKSADRSSVSETAINDNEVSRESRKSNEQILNTSNLVVDNDSNHRVAKRYLQDREHTSEQLLSPQSARCNSEISDEYASSRSDSPTERRGSTNGTKGNVFRRESRFRSVRNRAFESGKMTAKDKKLLKMILVIFSSFLICYLPITITKTFKDIIDWRGLNIAGYILIYLTTCINPVIYVVMSSEYRCAYKNVLLCRSDSTVSNCKQNPINALGNNRERRNRNRDIKQESN